MRIHNWDRTLLPYEQIVSELITKFKSLSNEYLKFHMHSPIEDVYGRVKSVGSILEKANKKNILYKNIESEMEDIAGIRIICKFVEDINKVVELIRLRDNKDLHVIEERDYIKNAKESGYRSYHVIIKYPIVTSQGSKELFCEIQIRTLAMNFWATVEHSLRYKYNDEIPKVLKDRLEISAEAAFNLDKEIGKIRDEILEAQNIISKKNDLVQRILKKIDKLYSVAKLGDINELHVEFAELYVKEDFKKLTEFNNKLNIMLHLYKIYV